MKKEQKVYAKQSVSTTAKEIKSRTIFPKKLGEKYICTFL